MVVQSKKSLYIIDTSENKSIIYQTKKNIITTKKLIKYQVAFSKPIQKASLNGMLKRKKHCVERRARVDRNLTGKNFFRLR